MNLALRIPDNATVLLDTNPIIYMLCTCRMALARFSHGSVSFPP